jgi:aminopeptidase N
LKRLPAIFITLMLLWSYWQVTSVSAQTYPRLEGPADWGRTHHFDMQHIKLELSFDEAQSKVIGRATTTLQPLKGNFTEFELDAVEMQIESVTLEDGRKLAFDYYNNRLKIQLDRAYGRKDTIKVVVSYNCQPRAGVFFVKPTDKYPNKPRQIWTQGEMEDNRRWFPTYDFPDDKTTTETLITVADNFTAIANGKLVGTKKNNNGTKTFHWLQDKPHVTYLVSFVVGEYVELKDTFDGIPVSYFVYKNNQQDAPRSLAKTPAMMKFFSERINYRYPYDKYAQTIVADFTVGGMENISATTLTDETIHPANAHEEFSSDGLVAHELAHQWWGDLLTCRTWPHLWLNEGFATFFATVWLEHDRNLNEALMERREDFQTYLNEERIRYRRPIVHNRYPEPDVLFDRTTYQKGGLILNLLRWQLGEEMFWRGISHYVNKFAFKSVDTNDFRIAMEEVTGESLGEFFDQWVYHGGYPEFKVTYDWNEQNGMVHLNVKQEQQIDDVTPLFRTPVEVEITTAKGKKIHRLRVNALNQDFFLQADDRPLMVRFDKPGALLKKLQFQRPLEQIIYQLANDPDALGRIEAAEDLRNFIDNAQVVAELTKRLTKDDFWGVRAAAALSLGVSKSTAAREALLTHRDPEFQVRLAIVEALGPQKNDAVINYLTKLVAEDASIKVVEKAAEVLGKTADLRALPVLQQALNRDSHRETIRAGALEGLSYLTDKSVVPTLLKWSELGMPLRARTSAIKGLGRVGKDQSQVYKALVELLEDPSYVVRREVISALREIGNPDVVPILEPRLTREVDMSVRYQIRATLKHFQRRP